MKTLMNLTVFDHDMNRFRDKEDLRSFYQSYGIEGLELQLLWREPLPEKIPAEDIVGIHTRMFPYWLDLWSGNTEALLEEFGTKKNLGLYYEGEEVDCILRRLKGELNRAQELGAKYVVFHVSDCRLSEVYTGQFHYRDEAVIDASCEIINALLDGAEYSFTFLVENLWWPGFRMTDPKLTERLMEGIHTEKKGIILDTGHLMHTNLDLRNEEEGIDYVERILDQHGELCRYIKGLHLHQSITGNYVKTVWKNPPKLKEDFWERLWQCMEHVAKIDQHMPFTTPIANRLIQRIQPDYLNLEYISANREEHAKKLATFRPEPLR
ncbi:MAG: TIM barrel protein [Bacillota bacterium]|nr:TIM barrel protein [Bacillota bacterium]